MRLAGKSNPKRNYMGQTLSLCGQYLAADGQLRDGCVQVKDGRIISTGPDASTGAVQLPPGSVILPGMIDLQINGAFGVDITEDPAAIQVLSRRLPERGVTAFLPTIITSPIEAYARMLQAVDLAPAPGGAVPLGLHLEGPFLNPQRKGAHRPEYICLPSPENLAHLLDPAKVRMISLAPERPGGFDAVERIRAAGILPAAAHSTATYDEARAAFHHGVGYGVHLFNAMPTLHHREPGLIGALLEPDAPPFGLIPDGVHLHPAVLRLVYRARGIEGITLVSDAMAAAGLGPGQHKLGDQNIRVDENSARLPDGTLAGSVILMDDALRCMVKFGVCDLPAAARMAAETPARLLGLGERKGRIAPGFDADLTVVDAQMRVLRTIVAGEVVYER
jgi:N-acetylglucosamine-6-phosphate deacetylase